MLRGVSKVTHAVGLLLLLATSTGAHVLMLAGGVWSFGWYLAPFGLLAGALVGGPQKLVLRNFQVSPTRSWLGAVCGWGAFGLVGSMTFWGLLSFMQPATTLPGFVAFASPAIVAASVAAGQAQAFVLATPSQGRFAERMTLAFLASGFVIALGLRLEQPWKGAVVAAVLWTVGCVLALYSLRASQGVRQTP